MRVRQPAILFQRNAPVNFVRFFVVANDPVFASEMETNTELLAKKVIFSIHDITAESHRPEYKVIAYDLHADVVIQYLANSKHVVNFCYVQGDESIAFSGSAKNVGGIPTGERGVGE